MDCAQRVWECSPAIKPNKSRLTPWWPEARVEWQLCCYQNTSRMRLALTVSRLPVKADRLLLCYHTDTNTHYLRNKWMSSEWIFEMIVILLNPQKCSIYELRSNLFLISLIIYFRQTLSVTFHYKSSSYNLSGIQCCVKRPTGHDCPICLVFFFFFTINLTADGALVAILPLLWLNHMEIPALIITVARKNIRTVREFCLLPTNYI